MAFLNQSEIDKLQMKMESLGYLKEIAYRARVKVKLMHLNVTNMHCVFNLETIEEIGEAIKLIDSKITNQNKYYESFSKLKYSYQQRIRTR